MSMKMTTAAIAPVPPVSWLLEVVVSWVNGRYLNDITLHSSRRAPLVPRVIVLLYVVFVDVRHSIL